MNEIESQKHLSWAHPLVRDWFLSKLGEPTEPQIKGWPQLLNRRSTLISAPTGSGKTLTAFLTSINQLVCEAASGELEDKIQVIYVSPLKALSNDVQKNLQEPLNEIAALAQERGIQIKEIRVGLRTGDTPASARRMMLKKPPHILVTTPETLYLMLTAEKSRNLIVSCQTLIVDEIHALVRDKRGVHLALSLERLESLCTQPLMRVGLSATQKPIDHIARFLVGTRRPMPSIVDIGHKRKRDLGIIVPKMPLSAVASHEMWDEIYDNLADLAKQNRSTLIFANTRRLAERVAHHLRERLGDDVVSAHHGSLSRTLRLDVENKLKEGKLKALVATASLELGIDIGELDLVCQIGSPRSIAVALQRVGRAGHFYKSISCGRFFVTTRDDLLESAALLRAIKHDELDALVLPKVSLDILAQQIVAHVSLESIEEDALYTLVTGAHPYSELTKETFLQVLTMLAEGISGSRGRYGAHLFRDRVNGVVSARRGSRLAAILNGGSIVDNGLFTVITESDGAVVGTLDEDFAVESSRGEIILLGTTSWRIKQILGATGKVMVENAHGAAPTVPFWRGEAPGRTIELSENVGRLREDISNRLPLSLNGVDLKSSPSFTDAVDWLKEECFVDDKGASQLLEYVFTGRSLLKSVPTSVHVIAERFFDDSGSMQLIIHAPFGARINKAWGLALRKCFCRSFNYELQASATDDGINISLLEQHSFPLADVFYFLHPNSVKKVLTQAVLQSPLFAGRFRFASVRSLSLPKFRGGKKIPPNLQRMLADDLLASVFPDAAACQDNLGGKEIEPPDHPLVNEALTEIFTDPLDMDGLINVLNGIYDGSIKTSAVDTITPSVFSHEILNANPYAFLDDAPLEERRARAVEMRNVLPNFFDELSLLDQAAIDAVKKQSFPDLRSKDELHDCLQTLVAMPMTFFQQQSSWQIYLNELIDEHRVAIAKISEDKSFAVAAERKQMFLTLYDNATLQNSLADIEHTLQLDRADALAHMIKHYMYILGPTTTRELSSLLYQPSSEIDAALLSIEASGLILRGNFREDFAGELEWCERRTLARIHRLTLERLRKEIEPATKEQFKSWLPSWHGVSSGTKRSGEEGLLEAIKQLQGFELPANVWEEQIFSRRVSDYKPQMLDLLGLKGRVIWGRLSLHKALNDDANQKLVIPRSTAPITFFMRDDMAWARRTESTEIYGISSLAKVIYYLLKEKGASFFSDIHRQVGGLIYSVETALWQLMSAGLVTADDFNNLRLFLSAKNRASSRQRVRFSTGRFFVLDLASAQLNVSDEDYRLSCARVLLQRYGVVFRDLLVRERTMPSFFALLNTFRLLESRGEIRGGCFVAGISGEQFALPEAVQSLRTANKANAPVEAAALASFDPAFVRI